MKTKRTNKKEETREQGKRKGVLIPFLVASLLLAMIYSIELLVIRNDVKSTIAGVITLTVILFGTAFVVRRHSIITFIFLGAVMAICKTLFNRMGAKWFIFIPVSMLVITIGWLVGWAIDKRKHSEEEDNSYVPKDVSYKKSMIYYIVAITLFIVSYILLLVCKGGVTAQVLGIVIVVVLCGIVGWRTRKKTILLPLLMTGEYMLATAIGMAYHLLEKYCQTSNFTRICTVIMLILATAICIALGIFIIARIFVNKENNEEEILIDMEEEKETFVKREEETHQSATTRIQKAPLYELPKDSILRKYSK